jgi:pantoate--beta-alanine ligase
MVIVNAVADLRAAVRGWRAAGQRIAFVPTMGNLHAGHFALVERARPLADRVVASVFVNPTQFGPSEDYARYPRTLDADARGLGERGCELVFAPTVAEMYPLGPEHAVRVHVPVLSEVLCGAFRPGHFDGVATVVARLFNLVQPDIAVFGQKDYQQVLVIRQMTLDLGFPISIETGATVREESGLAMSSRNQYLSAEERARAAEIQRTLGAMADGARRGLLPDDIERRAFERLEQAGFRPDYAALRSARDLAPLRPGEGEPRVAMIAAWLGKARLIDNLLID